MQFLVVAHEGTDEQAMDRRLAARPAHLERSQTARSEGKLLWGGAILDDEEKMIGSAMLFEFETREQLDEWVKKDPYVEGDVWRHIEIHNFRAPAHN